uniref:Uncharacterized protein n=1 Tax=Zea mays TaxID=4577 RepID=C0PK85_MAIZE|nr:unknown [Zea mays]
MRRLAAYRRDEWVVMLVASRVRACSRGGGEAPPTVSSTRPSWLRLRRRRSLTKATRRPRGGARWPTPEPTRRPRRRRGGPASRWPSPSTTTCTESLPTCSTESRRRRERGRMMAGGGSCGCWGARA